MPASAASSTSIITGHWFPSSLVLDKHVQHTGLPSPIVSHTHTHSHTHTFTYTHSHTYTHLPTHTEHTCICPSTGLPCLSSVWAYFLSKASLVLCTPRPPYLAYSNLLYPILQSPGFVDTYAYRDDAYAYTGSTPALRRCDA